MTGVQTCALPILLVAVNPRFSFHNRLTRLVSAPGMWLQNWTTFEPDDSMIEVGIRAFTLVLPEEKGKDQW